MALQNATCAWCRREDVTLKADGTVRAHVDEQLRGSSFLSRDAGRCAGSGKLPARAAALPVGARVAWDGRTYDRYRPGPGGWRSAEVAGFFHDHAIDRMLAGGATVLRYGTGRDAP